MPKRKTSWSTIWTLTPTRGSFSSMGREVVLDLIGPWMVNAAQECYEFYALICIDTVPNFPDAVQLRDKTASDIQM
jgi:hypothetical protein